MRNFNFLLNLLCACAVLLSPAWATSCDDDKQEVKKVDVTGVKLNKETLSLVMGTSESLVATIEPEDADNRDVTWKSEDPSVATVSEYGQVTGVGVGKTTVTVTAVDGAKTASCTVYVTEEVVPVTRVVVDKPTLEIKEGESGKLTASVAPEDATNQNVAWSSSDENIARADQDGTVHGIGEGTATITVTSEDGGKTATCEVTVLSSAIAVTGVSVNPVNIGLRVGQSTTIGYTVVPEEATNKNVTWSSSNSSVATVDQNGEVTAKAIGKADITATTVDGGKTAVCEVSVVDYEIYVAGYEGTNKSPVAYMWVNGVATRLGDEGVSSNANALYIDGGDVYIAGKNGSEMVYWKNGQKNVVGEHPNSELYGVWAANGNVYTVGREWNSFNTYATIWTNQSMLNLSNETNSAARGVWVSGSDVYVVGQENAGHEGESKQFATVWKNGEVLYRLPSNIGEDDIFYSSDGTGICIDGSDVYVTGTQKNPYWATEQARVWKNGEQIYHYLTTGEAGDHRLTMAKAICIYEGDVYVAGESADYNGVVWKNGEIFLNVEGAYVINGMCIFDGDVYTTGYSTAGYVNKAVIWKNAEEMFVLESDDPSQYTTGMAIGIKVIN